jgi:hypothetical protein
MNKHLDFVTRDYTVDAVPTIGRAGDVVAVCVVPKVVFKPEKMVISEIERGLFVRTVRCLLGFLFNLARWEKPQAATTGNQIANLRIVRDDGTQEPIRTGAPMLTACFTANTFGNALEIRVLKADEKLMFDLHFVRPTTVYTTCFGKTVVSVVSNRSGEPAAEVFKDIISSDGSSTRSAAPWRRDRTPT